MISESFFRWAGKSGEWDQVQALTTSLLANMSLNDKVQLMKGSGILNARCTGNTASLPTISYLGLCFQDGPAGLRSLDFVSSFPAGITTAATWSKRLMRARGRAIGEEAYGKGVSAWLGPAVDVMRSPYAGRGWEGFGADPWLNGVAGAETVKGVQSCGVMAVGKHVLAYTQEHDRFFLDTVVDDRTVHEVYGYPFSKLVAANVSALMCGYGQLNGNYRCEDLGTDAESDNLGLFNQYMFFGGGVYAGHDLLSAARDNLSVAASVDASASRILGAWLRLRQDEVDYPLPNYSIQESSGPQNEHLNVRSDNHTALIREIGAAGAVLLKNDGILPLSSGIGDVSGRGTTTLRHLVAPLDALSAYFNSSNSSSTATLISSTSDSVDEGGKVAGESDVVIVFVKSDSGEFGDGMTEVHGNYGDRNHLSLWDSGDDLILAATSNCSNVVRFFPTPLNLTEGLFIDYRHFDQHNITPRFPFGFGLSYTSFTYSNLSPISNQAAISLSFIITNVGAVAGTEIAQVYVGFPAGSGEPSWQLKGFEDVYLQSRESRNFTITIDPQDLCIWDVVAQDWTRPAGEFEVLRDEVGVAWDEICDGYFEDRETAAVLERYERLKSSNTRRTTSFVADTVSAPALSTGRALSPSLSSASSSVSLPIISPSNYSAPSSRRSSPTRRHPPPKLPSKDDTFFSPAAPPSRASTPSPPSTSQTQAYEIPRASPTRLSFSSPAPTRYSDASATMAATPKTLSASEVLMSMKSGKSARL
ncbi:cellulose-binding beta-glucosidase [Pseudohyphozyma bogoriensis]|nr:cellulose-binding beta-glucosidase [Pseudohyphozyma bogoriensis]